jgi:hypothetical protein
MKENVLAELQHWHRESSWLCKLFENVTINIIGVDSNLQQRQIIQY